MGNNTECLFICKAAGQYIWFALNICVKNIILSRKNNNTKVTGVKIGNIDLIVCDRYRFTQKIPFDMWIIKCVFKICLIIYNYILMHIYFYIYHCVIAFIYIKLYAFCLLASGYKY